MTIGDDVLKIIPDMRSAARSLMIDEGTITRFTGGGTIDPTTGDYTPAVDTIVYSGPCRLRKPAAVEQQVVFGDVNVTLSRYIVNLPYDAPLLQVGDVFMLTDTDDLEALNVPLRVAVIVAKSVLMYRQVGLEAIEQPTP